MLYSSNFFRKGSFAYSGLLRSIYYGSPLELTVYNLNYSNVTPNENLIYDFFTIVGFLRGRLHSECEYV